MTLRLTETRGSRSCPAADHASKELDLLRLKLVERNLGVLQRERRAHQVHPLFARPDGRFARAGPPPDPVAETGRLWLDGEQGVAGAAADVGPDDARAGDRGA